MTKRKRIYYTMFWRPFTNLSSTWSGDLLIQPPPRCSKTLATDVQCVSQGTLTYNAYHREHWRTVRVTGNTDVQCVSQGTLTYSAYHREHWRTVRITGNTDVQCVSQGTLAYSAYHREHWRTVRITGNTDVQCLSQGTQM